MKPRVYLETTIPSYLVARPSRDLVVAAHQQLTRDWWDSRRSQFEIFVSAAVMDECSSGDPSPASQRIELVKDLPILAITDGVVALADQLMQIGPLPANARFDAVHIATAACHGMDFLLTWNCKHIANAAMIPKFDEVCRMAGFRLPTICTPEFLLEG